MVRKTFYIGIVVKLAVIQKAHVRKLNLNFIDCLKRKTFEGTQRHGRSTTLKQVPSVKRQVRIRWHEFAHTDAACVGSSGYHTGAACTARKGAEHILRQAEEFLISVSSLSCSIFCAALANAHLKANEAQSSGVFSNARRLKRAPKQLFLKRSVKHKLLSVI